MSLLLDTHTFLWFVGGDKQLPPKLKEYIEKPNNACFISIASFWEIAIKTQIGKLDLGISLKELYKFAINNNFEIIPINFEHLLQLSKLPIIHNDPFDRIIIAQATSEKLTIATKDSSFLKYKIKVTWN